MKKKVTIFGSTGSIGIQALEVLEKLQDKFEIYGLCAGSNADLLNEQIKKFNPKKVCVSKNANQVNFNSVLVGENGMLELASDKNSDIILMAVSGRFGLKPTLAAIENGIDIALANKETLVMAGEIVMSAAKKHNVNILPVDSEHSAIHQCIKNIQDISKLIITASGGPFLNKSAYEMEHSDIHQVLAHPRWKMGKKITVDSATLMNKGLEVIEAHHLFGLSYDDIEVVIHPQSIIHSAVEYKDGSVIAQLGLPSMHIPIQYTLTFPERLEGIKSKSFSFSEIARLDFSEPNLEKFPCLRLALKAGRIGKSAPIVMNAANEEAVFAFLNGKISYNEIFPTVEKIYNKVPITNPLDIDEIFALDNEIRELTKEAIG